ncbi:MAG: YraN family protein [Gammaproteobacteria bacterium]|nr:YraN family protein [Gammaproteobacteria bacterium]MBU1415654.1 YraN family protein [Gammaproteobacteria bacterium]
MTSTQAKGAAGEDTAARFLSKQGLRVIDRNFRVRGGEIDLICRDGSTVVFVEVRLRGRSDYGGAADSITAAKRAKIVLAARHWLARGQQHDLPCRFDCVLLDGERIEWLRDAFSAD